MVFSRAQRIAIARMKYNVSSGFKPNSVTKGLFNRIKYKTAANRIGSWFKRYRSPLNAVRINNAKLKDELSRFSFSKTHEASVRKHYASYSKMRKVAPSSRVSRMYVSYGWYNKPMYLK